MFDSIVYLFDISLYKPLFNILVALYNYIPGHDFGFSVIILTVLIRIVLYPITVKTLNSQKVLQKLQPQLQEIQKKYKDDKEKQAKETFELYRKEKINPFSGFFLSLIQLPVLIALYKVFWQGLSPSELKNLYSFIQSPVIINTDFIGLIDLSKPNIVFAILAGVLQFFQTKMILPKTGHASGKEVDFSQIMQKQMLYFFPVLTVIILMGLPSAIGLYWTVSGIFSIVQQYFILKDKNKK